MTDLLRREGWKEIRIEVEQLLRHDAGKCDCTYHRLFRAADTLEQQRDVALDALAFFRKNYRKWASSSGEFASLLLAEAEEKAREVLRAQGRLK